MTPGQSLLPPHPIVLVARPAFGLEEPVPFSQFCGGRHLAGLRHHLSDPCSNAVATPAKLFSGVHFDLETKDSITVTE
jgi:hypothetical protein